MSSILLIGFNSNGRDCAKLEEYQAELQQSTIDDVCCCYYDEISIELSPNSFVVTDHRNSRSLGSYDMVIFRGAIDRMYLSNAICQFLALHNIRFVNDYRDYKAANKLLQLIECYELGIPFPPTIYSANYELLCSLASEKLGYPMIVKAAAGAHGEDNFLVHNEDEFHTIDTTKQTVSFIAQAYIPNDYDHRILFVGEECIVVERRGQQNSHLNNLSQGATIQVVGQDALPARVLTDATRLVRHSKLVLAGVDVIVTPKGHFFLEVNSQPGWRTLENEVAPLLKKLFEALP